MCRTPRARLTLEIGKWERATGRADPPDPYAVAKPNVNQSDVLGAGYFQSALHLGPDNHAAANPNDTHGFGRREMTVKS